jgi:hypothetical protein
MSERSQEDLEEEVTQLRDANYEALEELSRLKKEQWKHVHEASLWKKRFFFLLDYFEQKTEKDPFGE